MSDHGVTEAKETVMNAEQIEMLQVHFIMVLITMEANDMPHTEWFIWMRDHDPAAY